jgi:hypothetical protein
MSAQLGNSLSTIRVRKVDQYGSTDEIRPYHNFAPFVRQIGEPKAQACSKAICTKPLARRTLPRVRGSAVVEGLR